MNAISWVEVPVGDMNRAVRFYNTVMLWDLKENVMGPLKMAWFPSDTAEHGAGGSLVENPHYTPSSDGALLYFQCPDVADNIGRVEEAGGQVLRGKTFIAPNIGYMALAIDTEGNRIAFHSKQ